MTERAQILGVGAAAITVYNVGSLRADLAEWLGLSRGDWPAQYDRFFEKPLSVPVQSIHIGLPGISVVVDPASTDLLPDSPYSIPGYRPPPGLLRQLAEAGQRPEDVDHVVITHAHFDHFNSTTEARDGAYQPCFPNARHHIGRADWDSRQLKRALRDPASTESRTLGVLHTHGLVDLVDGDRDLGHGVQIIAAPGESPGHQIVRVDSEGETLYCLGDLYHHLVEVEQPEWMVTWADTAADSASRKALVASSLQENALLVPAHIHPGRLQRTDSGVTWSEV